MILCHSIIKHYTAVFINLSCLKLDISLCQLYIKHGFVTSDLSGALATIYFMHIFLLKMGMVSDAYAVDCKGSKYSDLLICAATLFMSKYFKLFA
jgi:hypothetical protein